MIIAETKGGLWLPPQFEDFFTVSIDGDADEETFNGMLELNKAAVLWANGQLDTGTYLDILEYYGQDPIEFVGEVIDHFELLNRRL